MNLKKYATVLVVGSFLLTGCGSSSKTVKEDDKYVIAALSDKNLLADDVFDNIIKTSVGKNAYFEAVFQQLMDKHCPVDDAMETDTDTIIEQMEAAYESNYEDNAAAQLEADLSSSGYESIDEYRQSLQRALQYSRFLEQYIENHYDETFDDYYTQASPRLLSMIYVSMADVESPTDEETAKLEEVKSLLESSKTFGDIATDYSDDSTSAANSGKLGVVDTTSGLSDSYGSDVETSALSLLEGETSIAIKGTDGYYFLKNTSVNKATIKEGIKDLGIDSPLISYDSYLLYIVYSSYELTYKDDAVKEIVTKVVSDALVKREEARGDSE